MSPTPPDRPAKRPRTRKAEPQGQGTWLDLGPADEAPADAPAAAAPDAPAPVPDEPEWLREVPVEPAVADAGPALAPEDIAKAIEARRQARAEEILSRHEPGAGPGGHNHRGAAADPCRCGLGQDPRRRPPDRVPHRRQGRPAAPDPRGHVHQPRRRRAPRADPHLIGEHGQGRRGRHVPRAVRASPPTRRRGHRARPPVRDLRHGRPAAADEADPGRGGPARDGRVPAGGDPRCDQPGQERHARRGVPRRERGQPPGADDRAPREALPGAAHGGRRARLRRPPARGRRPVRRGARRAGAVPAPLALPPRRRVPGHEPAAVPVGPGARRRAIATCASSATTTSRSTAGAARTSRTSSTSSATTPRRRSSSSSRTTARRSSSSMPPTRSSRATSARTDKKLWTQNQGGVPIQRFEAFNEDEEAEWIARQVEGLIGQTGRGSWLTRRADDDESTRFRPKDVAVMYRMNAQSPSHRGGVPPLRDPLPARRRDAVLPAARGQGRARVPAGAALGHGRRELRADHQRPGARDRRQERRGAAAAVPSGTRTTCSRRSTAAVARRGRGARAADPDVAGRVRGPRREAADADRRAAAARAARRRPRGVRLPGDARRRLRGGRGPLGEPARAARRSRPATTT